MKTFYIFLHPIMGSMYEATYPQSIFGPYSEDVSKKIASKMEKELDSDEWCVNIIDISESTSSEYED